ncbi:MAG TPA: hypothetical protein VMV44_15625 [Rectinemataceae bacterium]|nr:hypothetical protein [Rectinemataceae bacterium]
MTRREIERIARAVRDIKVEMSRTSLPISAARISQFIGRAVLGQGASLEAWKKWMKATGWPEDLIQGMAENEAKR